MPGQPVHIEIPAKDTSRAQQFYKNMFGWEFQDMEGPQEYHMTRLSENAGGAVFHDDDEGDHRLLPRGIGQLDGDDEHSFLVDWLVRSVSRSGETARIEGAYGG